MKHLVSLCEEASAYLSRNPLDGSILKRLKKDARLRDLAGEIDTCLHAAGEVYAPAAPVKRPTKEIKAVTWNIERGKNFNSILRILQTHEDLKGADLYFLTEVDWGMVRSGNRNVAVELGERLGLYAYFAPSYFNFTIGHGSERHLSGRNTVGLHGKAILSRYPLTDLRASSIANATNILTSKESRLGQKRSLIGHLEIAGTQLALACIHLDAFSSPRMRARQIEEAVAPLLRGTERAPALIAGDWNTNTINSSSGRTVLLSVLRQLLLTGPKKMIVQHHPFPEKKYDRRLFQTLLQLGFDFESFNEMGVGTYDVVNNDMELGQMAMDQFPKWVLQWINRLIARSGGLVSLKLDWFAGRGLQPLDKKVVRPKPEDDYPPNDRPSDHHPVLLKVCLPAS